MRIAITFGGIDRISSSRGRGLSPPQIEKRMGIEIGVILCSPLQFIQARVTENNRGFMCVLYDLNFDYLDFKVRVASRTNIASHAASYAYKPVRNFYHIKCYSLKRCRISVCLICTP